MGSSWSRGPKCNLMDVLISNGKETQTRAQRRSHVKREAEREVRLPRLKGCRVLPARHHQKLERQGRLLCLRLPGECGSAYTSTGDASLQNCEQITFCDLKLPS